jgi:hypothetical protein
MGEEFQDLRPSERPILKAGPARPPERISVSCGIRLPELDEIIAEDKRLPRPTVSIFLLRTSLHLSGAVK